VIVIAVDDEKQLILFEDVILHKEEYSELKVKSTSKTTTRVVSAQIMETK
jgi:hypothetical protein